MDHNKTTVSFQNLTSFDTLPCLRLC